MNVAKGRGRQRTQAMEGLSLEVGLCEEVSVVFFALNGSLRCWLACFVLRRDVRLCSVEGYWSHLVANWAVCVFFYFCSFVI